MQYPVWLKDLIKRLRKALGFSATDRPKVRILEQYHDDGISVLRLQDSSIPGCVDLWRIDRHYERTKFFVLVINTQSLREDLAALGTSLSTVTQSRGSSVARILQSQLQQQASVLATHYWVCGFDKECSAVDPQGRHYRSHRLCDVHVLAVDLQGAAGIFAGDRYAQRFARQVIKQIAACEFREYSRFPTWQQAVKSIDWHQWLEGLCRGLRGIDVDHVLQPKRPGRSPSL